MRAKASQQSSTESSRAKRRAHTPVSRVRIYPAHQAPMLQRKPGCACGGGCPRCQENELSRQTKLKIGKPGDKYEQEADRVAEQVMRMPSPPFHRLKPRNGWHEPPAVRSLPSPSSSPLSQTNGWHEPPAVRSFPAHPPIQASSEAALAAEKGFDIPPSIEARISHMQGSGSPLPDEERTFFEDRMGYDFSKVRIHTDANAVQASREVQARAFTTGNNMAFNEGTYQPGTNAGRRLLVHELTHVVQQGSQDHLRREPSPTIQPAPEREPLTEPLSDREWQLLKLWQSRGEVDTDPLTEDSDHNALVVADAIFCSRFIGDVRFNDRGEDPLLCVISDITRADPRVQQLAPHVTARGPIINWTRVNVDELAESLDHRWAQGPGSIKGSLGTTKKGHQVTAHYFAGQSDERALVIGGVHGSELSGIEVANKLVEELSSGTKAKPYYTVIIVPTLFPDNAAHAEENPKSIGSTANIGRKTKGHKVDPNRQFPKLGDAFDPDNPVDAKGRKIEPENVMLLELIQRFQPSRIASVHAVRKKDVAGIFADPRTDAEGLALGYEDDKKLAVTMAERAAKGGANVPANKLESRNPNALYPRDPKIVKKGKPQPRDTSRGISLGGWGSHEIRDDKNPQNDKAAMTIITVEVQTSVPSKHAKKQEERLKEIQAHSDALREIFLGPP